MKLATYLTELEELVNTESGSRFPAGTKRVAEYMQAKFQKLGWKTELLPIGDVVGPCLFACNQEAENYDLLLIGHMDTVFPEGTVAERPYTREGDRAYGPGVIDMKSGLLYAYYLAEHIMETAALKDKKVAVLFNPDEEISSMYSRATIEKIAATCKHVIVLEPARANGATVKTRKGIGKYFITFEGVAAHAGVNPEDGASAIDELCRFVTEINTLRNPENGTTVNAGVISGGTAPNVVAEKAYVEIDVRISTIEDGERVDSKVHELADNPANPKIKIHVEGGIKRPPLNNPAVNEKLCVLLEDAAKEEGIEINWIHTGGGSDANFTSAIGVPTLDTLGPIGGGAHGIGEYIDLTSIEPRFNLLTRVVGKIFK